MGLRIRVYSVGLDGLRPCKTAGSDFALRSWIGGFQESWDLYGRLDSRFASNFVHKRPSCKCMRS